MTEQKDHDQAFAERLADSLRDGEQALAPEVRDQLAESRRAAVAIADNPSAVTLWPRYVGAGALASVALVGALMLRPDIAPLPDLDDVELAVVQDAELLEDLEFAAWMMAMEEADEPSNSG